LQSHSKYPFKQADETQAQISICNGLYPQKAESNKHINQYSRTNEQERKPYAQNAAKNHQLCQAQTRSGNHKCPDNGYRGAMLDEGEADGNKQEDVSETVVCISLEKVLTLE
jgi:hypothetical protein